MCHDLRSPSNFHAALLALDTRTIEEHRAMRCPACAGPLCRSDYPRKAWGVDARARPLYARRFSLCCTREGCRVRVTPRSARFLGRRRYPAFWVVLISILSQQARPQHCRRICERIGLSERTLTRWRQWWREWFGQSPFWRVWRSRFLPVPTVLPRDLLGAFCAAGTRGRLLQMLDWLGPCGQER